MAYAQTNYSQLQGKTVNGVRPKYSIAQIGCFITAFCNLEERFGRAIDPPTMDNELARLNLYIDVDDGVYDDVGWTTITAFDPSIVVTKTGSGAPTDNNSIVKFSYKSSRTGQFTTHFSLVVDAARGLILDSWDGVVKSWNGYGGPVAYATYTKAGEPASQGGDNPVPTRQEIIDEYLVNRGSAPSEPEINVHLKGTWKSMSLGFKKENDDRRAAVNQQVSALQTALANEQSKPPKEVVKEVEKIVEKIVEVPVEVIRPVEVIKEPGWLIKVRSWINEFLNKK